MSSVPQEPPATPDPAAIHRAARMFAYIESVFSGAHPECDGGTAERMAGMIVGQRAGMLERLMPGMTRKRSMARAEQWVRDQAALWGSMAATTDGAPEGE